MSSPLFKKKTFRSSLFFGLTAFFIFGCASDKTAPSSAIPAQTVSVTISPQAVTLSPGGETSFTASVSGSTNTAVDWSIQEGSAGGTITSTNGGNYAAPPSSGTYHVVATSQIDSTKTATATITVSTSLKTSFGTNGASSTAIGGIDSINAMAIQSDGKIIVAGASLDGMKSNFALARYEVSGVLDTTFGTNGFVTTSFGNGLAEIKAIAIQPDGKIVGGGITDKFKNGKFALARYLTDGSLDTSFGTSSTGTVTALPGTDDNRLNALVLQGDKILVGGASFQAITDEFPQGKSTFTLMRFQSDGSVDTSFGSDNNGIVKTLVLTGSSEIFDLALHPSTSDIVAGGYSTLSGGLFAVARYDSNGSLDPSFSTDGIVTTTVGGNDQVKALLIQSTGEIVAAGFSNNAFALVRYTTSGVEDTTFSGDGIATTSIGSGGGAVIHGLSFDNNRIIAGGLSFSGAGNSAFTLARYDLAGALDTAFGSGGILTTDISAGLDGIHSIQLIPSVAATQTTSAIPSKIIAAGFSANGPRIDFALARYVASDGSLDTTFDNDGFATTALGGGSDEINALGVQSDDKIIAAGFSFGVNNLKNKDFSLTRYLADGTLDPSFGVSGRVTTSIAAIESTGHDVIKAIAIQSDDKIIVAGTAFQGTVGASEDFVIARYLSNGTLDTSFGSGANGIETRTNVGADEVINTLALLGNGKVLVAGTAFTGTRYDFILGRYTASGILDTSFDTDGILTTPIGTGSSFAEAMAVQTDGKIVLAGSTESITSLDFALTRYLADGTLDTSFDSDGIVTTSIGAGNDAIWAIKIQSDGKILVAGTTTSSTGPEQFALARYNTDGSLDTGFGTNGIVITALGNSSIAKGAKPFSLAIQDSDGTIIVGGFSEGTSTRRDFSLVRYLSDGTLDTSFAVEGIEISPFSTGMDEIHALRILSDGTILAGGMSTQSNSENSDFHLAGYTP